MDREGLEIDRWRMTDSGKLCSSREEGRGGGIRGLRMDAKGGCSESQLLPIRIPLPLKPLNHSASEGDSKSAPRSVASFAKIPRIAYPRYQIETGQLAP